MKKLLSFFVVITAITIILASFRSTDALPKLYPELENYFKSVETKDINKEHMKTLESIKSNVLASHMDFNDWYMIFYCSENTFRSQASQVFAQTLCYAKMHRRMKIFSAGLKSGVISEFLIEYLTKIGYKVTKKEEVGRIIYEVKFSDQAKPIVLYSKDVEDKSLPSRNFLPVIVCDVEKETDCKDIKTQLTYPLNLAFPEVTTADESQKAETVLKSIAAEMVYVTNK